MSLMLAFCAASNTCRPPTRPWYYHSVPAWVASYQVRTQNELTIPAQKLLLPECKVRNSSLPSGPLSFLSSHLASYIPSPKLTECHHPAPGPWHPTSWLPASINVTSFYSVRSRAWQKAQLLRPHFSDNIITIITLVTKNYVVCYNNHNNNKIALYYIYSM